jgi:hypothetical protein
VAKAIHEFHVVVIQEPIAELQVNNDMKKGSRDQPFQVVEFEKAFDVEGVTVSNILILQ